MTFAAVPVVLIVLASTLWTVFFGGRLPQPFRSRSCQGKDWRQAFPSASKQEIREFMIVFSEAFAFSNKESLKLNPNDSIYHIYRALYPGNLTPDGLELETFAARIESRYGIRLCLIWREQLTLGELFATVRQVPTAIFAK